MNGADFQMAEKIPGAAPSPDTPTSEARAAGAEVDVVVIGGGIQGAGAAQAAAAAGFKVALLERREAAIGTSSRSSKLIHGGLRYLESYQFSLVRESLEERQTLLKIAACPPCLPAHPNQIGSADIADDVERRLISRDQ